MNILRTAKKIFAKPTDFFDKDVHEIQTWKEPVNYLVIFILFITLFLTFHYLRNLATISKWFYDMLGTQSPIPIIITPTIGHYLILYFITVIALIAVSFLKYWIVNWFIRLWNKKATYKETYKILTYSTTPGWVGVPFFVIFSFLIFFALRDGGWAYWTFALISLAITLVLEIYNMYLRSYAVARTNGFGIWKAFLIIYIYSWLTYLVMIFLIEFILISIVILIVLVVTGSALILPGLS